MVRKLKVNEKWVERRLDVYRTRQVPIASISLQGKWLEEAGFEPVAYVEVVVENGRLVIERIG